jgi:hypothetical protein
VCGVAAGETSGTLDEAALAFAHRLFDLARGGHIDELAAQVDAALGRRSALATAAVFELPDMQELLTTGRGR